MSPNAEASGTVRKARKKFDAWHGVPDDVSNIRNKNPTTKKKKIFNTYRNKIDFINNENYLIRMINRTPCYTYDSAMFS